MIASIAASYFGRHSKVDQTRSDTWFACSMKGAWILMLRSLTAGTLSLSTPLTTTASVEGVAVNSIRLEELFSACLLMAMAAWADAYSSNAYLF